MTFLSRLLCFLFGCKPIVNAHGSQFRLLAVDYADPIVHQSGLWYYDQCARCRGLAPHRIDGVLDGTAK